MHTWRNVGCCLVAAVCGALSALAGTTYYLAGDDTNNGSSFTGANQQYCGGWATTDGGTKVKYAVEAGNDYIVSKGYTLRTPNTSGCTFSGNSLTLGAGGCIALRMTKNSTLTINNCIVTGNPYFNCWISGASFTIAGNFLIQEGGVLQFRSLGGSKSDVRNLTISADVSGAGTLKMYYDVDAVSHSIGLSGSLAGLTGPVLMQGGSKQTIKFLSESSFPADASMTTVGSVVIGGGTTVDFEASGLLGENRGIEFTAATPTIYVAAGKTVVFNGATSGDAGFVKTGAGDLVLSNDTQMVSGTVTVKAGRLFYKPALAKSATIKEDGGTAIELESEAKVIDLSCSGYEGVADGVPHGITVEVTDPADGAGCTFEWSTDGGVTWSDDKPMFVEAGRRTVVCRISADGYVTRICQAEVVLRHQGTVYVSPTGSAVPPFDTPEKATHDIAEAVDYAADGQKVQVESGTYSQALSVDRSLTLAGPADRSAVLSGKVTLSGNARISGLSFRNGSGILTVAAGCVASNCLFASVQNAVLLGGEVVDCDFTDCAGNFVIQIAGNAPRMVRTVINHSIGTTSGPITPKDDSATRLYMEDCIVVGCTNQASGGAAVFGFASSGGNVVLNRSRFIGNTGRFAVARTGVSNPAWSFYATNCLFAANRSVYVGSGQYDYPCSHMSLKNADFVNCTFAGNSSELSKQKLFEFGGNAKIVNSVLSDNSDMQCAVANLTYDHSLYPEADGTSGNVTGPAVFSKRRRENEPYRLDPSSPGVGGGLLLGWTSDDIDLSGRPRVRGARKVDMGCFSLQTFGFALLLK